MKEGKCACICLEAEVETMTSAGQFICFFLLSYHTEQVISWQSTVFPQTCYLKVTFGSLDCMILHYINTVLYIYIVAYQLVHITDQTNMLKYCFSGVSYRSLVYL